VHRLRDYGPLQDPKLFFHKILNRCQPNDLPFLLLAQLYLNPTIF
jgi:hypothetical protein